MKGSARVKRSARTNTKIDLAVEKMPRPFELGAGYATYVLWAIGPDGQVDNLGEIKRSGFCIRFKDQRDDDAANVCTHSYRRAAFSRNTAKPGDNAGKYHCVNAKWKEGGHHARDSIFWQRERLFS